MNKYRINIHSHSYFSDGTNSPYRMGLEAKRLGFSALVITDHWDSMNEDSLTAERYSMLETAVFEAYNSGLNKFEKRGFGVLRNIPAWSNSDAHRMQELKDGWNEVDTNVETEHDLIKYIKSGKQPIMFANGKPVEGRRE